MIGAVVLNYNSWQETKSVALSLAGMEIIDDVAVVDNKSSDDSWLELKKLESKKIHVIEADQNLGYAAGNNIGIKYLASEKIICEYIFVINPDVIVTEECFREMVRVFQNHKKIGILGAVRTDINGEYTQRQCWEAPTVMSEIKGCFSVFRGIQKKQQICKFLDEANEVEEVGVVPGSFWGAPASVLKEINFLDEKTFLYYEENILSYKLKKAGYTSGICTKAKYIHNHKNPKNSDFKKKYRNFCIMQKSRTHFQNTYLQMSWPVSIFLKICMKLEYIEKIVILALQKIVGR